MGPAQKLTFEEFRTLFDQVCNWGRWGAEDQRGALNFITAEKRQKAGTLIREGFSVGASSVVNTTPAPDNRLPAIHHMTSTYDVTPPDSHQGAVADFLGVGAHGHAFTHLDALCHMAFEGKVYNGQPATGVVTSRGALSHAIDVAQDGIVSRGVLLDVPRARSIDWIEPGECVYPEDLDAAERAAGTRVEEGDILLIRVGRHRRREAQGPWDTMEQMPGLHPRVLPWIHQRRIAVLGCDGSSETFPSPVDSLRNPMHMGVLVSMGVHMIDNCYLEGLSRACAERSRWEFMFIIAPLKLKGGTGLLINPIALF